MYLCPKSACAAYVRVYPLLLPPLLWVYLMWIKNEIFTKKTVYPYTYIRILYVRVSTHDTCTYIYEGYIRRIFMHIHTYSRTAHPKARIDLILFFNMAFVTFFFSFYVFRK